TLITLPWAKHIEFLRERSARNEITRSVSDAIKMHAGHPAIFAYLVGNEIAPQMVRWLGVRRVTEFIEHLIGLGRSLDPRVFFSWTDECYTGEQEVTDWAFGLVTRDRQPKKALHALREKLGQDDAVLPHRHLNQTPSVSVIVCSYNAGATLRSCLESLGKIDYPKFEIVLVDDGSTDNTAQIAAEFPNVRYVHQPNRGLSVARNTG